MTAPAFAPSRSAAIGRAFLSAIFIASGLGKILGWSASAAYMAAAGMPAVPLFLSLAIVVELGGGLALFAGFHARWAALLLFCSLIPVSLVFHHFWTLSGMERQMQMVQFLKNLAIMGGLLLVFSFGPGRPSVDEGRNPE